MKKYVISPFKEKVKGKCDYCHAKRTNETQHWIFYEEPKTLNIDKGFEFCSNECYDGLITDFILVCKDYGFKEPFGISKATK